MRSGKTIGGKLVKRSDCLVFFFQAGSLHCKNYLTGREFEASPHLVPVLDKLDRWHGLRRIEQLLSGYSPESVRNSLRGLIANTAVIIKGGPQAKRESALKAWKTWGVEARFFHLATKNTHKTVITINEARFNRELKKREAPPPAIKRYLARPRIQLPDTDTYLHGQLPETLLNRRTHRDFGPGGVSLNQLSVLLRLTWGFTSHIYWPGLGSLPTKTSPSGGARHSLEVYLWTSRADGLAPGIYHYRPDRHALDLLKSGNITGQMARLCGYQQWVRNCSVLFVMTTVLARVMWRYRFSRAYRVILLEAGHFGQTFCLVSTWLGLAPFCTAALDDEKIDKDLNLGAGEAVLYALGVGTRAK
jgi:SagB-type dehydrogenase family enzyme